MNVKILNPFLEAVIEVMKVEVGVTVTKGDLTLQKSALTTDDVTVLINLVGQIYGVVMYGMPISTGIQVVSRIMGQEFAEFDSLAQSGIAELGNVITGRATVKFSEAGFQSNISPPMVIAGKGLQVSTLDFPRIIVPLKSDIGDMVVHLALREMVSGTSCKPEEFVSLVVKPSDEVG
jgi:chemotaxis protein CheX